MLEIEKTLYKTRKSLLDVCSEFDVEYIDSGEISLKQCNSCGIWLKPQQLLPDLDGLDICNDCLTYYGP